MGTNTEYRLKDLEWVGGHPALDFVNTVNAWHGERPGAEYLHGYAELLEWNRMADLLDTGDARALDGTTRAKSRAHRRAIELRDALHRIFRALADERPPPANALERLNDVLRDTVRWRRLDAAGGEIRGRWDFDGAPPLAALGPVAWRAAELLEHGPAERIKQCPDDEGCGWVFLDTSKNRSRTWCSMKTCGNHAKVKRFRARHSRESGA